MTELSFSIVGREPAGEPLRYTACGLDDVYLVNGFTRDIIDGERAVTIEDMDGLWKAIGLHLVSKRKALAPKEIRFLRDHMGLTQAELGARLRVSDQTVARWEKDECDISGPADLMIRVFFLASEAAQPEGGKILEHLTKMLDELAERDEPQPHRVVFRHGRKRWKEERCAMVA